MGSWSKDFVLVEEPPVVLKDYDFRCQNERCRKPLEVDEFLLQLDFDSLPTELEGKILNF